MVSLEAVLNVKWVLETHSQMNTCGVKRSGNSIKFEHLRIRKNFVDAPVRKMAITLDVELFSFVCTLKLKFKERH